MTNGSLRERLRDYERKLIEEALASTHGNQVVAAQLLDLPLRTLVYKIRQLGIRARRQSGESPKVEVSE